MLYLLTMPEGPAADSPSARWLQPGPFEVGSHSHLFTDPGRSTQANGDFPGSGSRSLHTRLWYPLGHDDGSRDSDHDDGLPLIIHSHGFMSNRNDMDYAAQHLASYGYVVAAADYPLTHSRAPGGALVTDVANQPGDVSYLINSLLGLYGNGTGKGTETGTETRAGTRTREEDEQGFSGNIDPARIGVMGLSLGGLTSTLAAFHPQMRDTRIRAAASVAGPAAFLGPRFFTYAEVPFLMIGGSADAIVPYDDNAAPTPARVPGGGLLSINGGSHIGFAAISEPWMRLRHNPDQVFCNILLEAVAEAQDEAAQEGTPAQAGLEQEEIPGSAQPAQGQNEAAFSALGDESIGIEFAPDVSGVCEEEMREAIHPGRQLMITRIAVLAFFQSILAKDPATRAEAAEILRVHLPQDFPEVRYTTGN